ncbi:nuclear transport factor 2 family protein [Nocardia sp. NPDC051990]|uniref:nuclear transport factor 2 family protein n=1 Tax=Nocardia sp. NPDC051990 TaxID=3155285 RepID=UPI003445995D
MKGPLPTRIEDRLAIQEQLYRYAYAFDDGDIEGFLDVFTPDAVWEAYLIGRDEPLSRLQSPDEFRAFVKKLGVPMAGTVLHHTSSLLFVELDEDSAVTRSMVVASHQKPSGPVIGTHGTYYDRWRKTPDGWRIEHRRYTAAGYESADRD